MFSLAIVISWFMDVLRPDREDEAARHEDLTDVKKKEIGGEYFSETWEMTETRQCVTNNRQITHDINNHPLRVLHASEDWDEEIANTETQISDARFNQNLNKIDYSTCSVQEQPYWQSYGEYSAVDDDSGWSEGAPAQASSETIENLNERREKNSDKSNWGLMDRLNELETCFSLYNVNSEAFLNTLQEILEAFPTPYDFLLYLIENHHSSVIEGKKSLAHVVLIQFSTWRALGRFSQFQPTELERDRALWIVTTRKLFLFDLCNKVFELDSKGNEYLQKHIFYLLNSKMRYKEAVTIATKLHLQPCFQPKEILLPLIILNKVQLAESYVEECAYQQRAFISMLDKLCLKSDDELETLANDVVPNRPTSCKITQASLVKLGERLVKKYNIDPDEFPELFKAKNRSGLSYLLHQRHKDKSGSTKKWDDLIERCVGDNQCLQETLVELLNKYGEKEEAKKWSRYYQLDNGSQRRHSEEELQHYHVEEDWDSEIAGNSDSLKDMECAQEGSSNKSRAINYESFRRSIPTYITFQIPMNRIYFVDDERSLSRCRKAVSKVGVKVGFDAEWKPQMCQAGIPQRLSIMQLSLRDEVYILDVIALAENVSDAGLHSFGNAFFANDKVLKLGYGVESDFKALIATWPVLEQVIKKIKRFVDLCSLSQHLFESPAMKRKVQKQTESLTSYGHISEKGLSLLVQQCLGMPLDKTYQLSDWEQRPLLKEQVIYAALDARCLLDVFDVLEKWMKQENVVVDLNKFSPRLPWLFPKQKRKPRARTAKHPKPGSSNFDVRRLNDPVPGQEEPLSPQDFRVVVDNMLQGLGRYLRCCGVDVVMLANGDDHEKAAMIAQQQDRVILTTGTPYYTLRSQVPLGQCLCVPGGNAKQQVMAVFKHYNINVKTSDIFSRCQQCNGNKYIKVDTALMRQAYINYYENEHYKDSQDAISINRVKPTTGPLNVDSLTLESGVKLQIETLPETILDRIQLFYCCASCGKIFWEGGHFTRICTQFSEVLEKTKSFYDAQQNIFK